MTNMLREHHAEYLVDDGGFLLDPAQWDEQFAQRAAIANGIERGLDAAHWKVVRFIRSSFKESGACPLVYQTCQALHLRLTELKELFPTGYMRGACKIAGLTYKEASVDRARLADRRADGGGNQEKVYRTDTFGFLMDYADWDEEYALNLAGAMKVPGGLTDRHFRILRYLRRHFEMYGTVPTVYETCEANQIDLVELELLFPDGYHRGAVKIAGLRSR